MPTALITGVTGQDGSYLAELLLARGYEVHAIVRREAIEDADRRLANISHLTKSLQLHVASIDNHLSVYKIIASVVPDECYHLAAASFVSYSFDDEASVLQSNFNATHFLLTSLKELAPHCRFYFAGSSEMFGHALGTPQDESTEFNPRSIYGISKLAAYHLVRNYRQNHGMFACAGILYNHESPRRGFEFVTRKITSAVARIHLGHATTIELGNVEARRDWGYAPDYVDAMHRIMRHDVPDDFVIATGTLHSVRDVLECAFAVVGLDYRSHLRFNPEYFRPDEAVTLCGNHAKAKRLLGWTPTRKLEDIVDEMVRKDIALLGAKE